MSTPAPHKVIVELHRKGEGSWSTGLGLVIVAAALALIFLTHDGKDGPSLRDALVEYLSAQAAEARTRATGCVR